MPYSPNSALGSKPVSACQLTIRQQVAQLFMVGYAGPTPTENLTRWIAEGLGGVIFFRDNFQHMTQPQQVQTLLSELQANVPAACPALLTGIDQEGGQVERLPHTIFPSLLTPKAIALASDPNQLAQEVYGILAEGLTQLGFNLDFFPTLDVNLNPENPVIGIRAFSDDPDQVWSLAQIALKQFQKFGLLPVGKHFPGHGNGTVDSHLSLPTLKFTEAELGVFQKAIDAGLPAVMVSHGYYPDLQSQEPTLPASASPTIIQTLLRKRCGFQGLVMSDDMCMGAIAQGQDSIPSALAALNAGIDLLIYRDSTEAQWRVFEAIVQAVETEAFSEDALTERVNRILAYKARIQPATTALNWTSASLESTSQPIAQRGISVLQQAPTWSIEALRHQPILLIHPQRSDIPNYAFDQPTSPELPALFEAAGFSIVRSIPYAVGKPDAIELPETSDAWVVFVSFNPRLHENQKALMKQLSQQTAPTVLISAGMPDPLLLQPVLHLGLCNYRPPSMQALVAYFAEKN